VWLKGYSTIDPAKGVTEEKKSVRIEKRLGKRVREPSFTPSIPLTASQPIFSLHCTLKIPSSRLWPDIFFGRELKKKGFLALRKTC